jgi:hypothetical protein
MEKRLAGEGGMLSAGLAYRTYVNGLRPPSRDEEEHNWLLVERGEILVYTFEWLLRQKLSEQGFSQKSSALRRLATPEGNILIQKIWRELVQGYSRTSLCDEEDDILNVMANWLKAITTDRQEYSGWWEREPSLRDWFIKGTELGSNDDSVSITQICPLLFARGAHDLLPALLELAISFAPLCR